MVLKWGFQTLVDNVGMSFEWIVVLLILVSALIIAAKSFQLALIVLLVTSGGIFAWFYEVGFEWTIPLIIMMMSLVILSLSLFATNTTSKTGGFQ